MRKLLLVSLLLTTVHLSSQSWVSSNIIQSDGDITVIKSSQDNQNNTFLLGFYDGTEISGSGFSATNYGNRDYFVSKINANGDLEWIKSIGGTMNDDITGGIYASIDNYIYVTGSFQNDLKYSPVDSISSTGSMDIFLMRLDQNGNIDWITTPGTGSNWQRSTSLSIADDGNILLAGYYKDSIAFYTDTTLYAGSTANHVFYAKFNSADGSFIWSKGLAVLTGAFGGRIFDIAIKSDHYIFSGTFSGSVVFGNETLNSNSNSIDVFFFKTNLVGEIQFTRTIKGSSGEYTYKSVLDTDNNIYFTGYYNSPELIIDSTETIEYLYNVNNGDFDFFITKYNSVGNLQWIKTAGGPGTDIIVDAAFFNNEINVSGFFTDTINWGGIKLSSSSATDRDMFIGALSLDGNFRSANSFGGRNNSTEDARSIFSDGTDLYTVIRSNSDLLVLGESIYTNPSLKYFVAIGKIGCLPINITTSKTDVTACFEDSTGTIFVGASDGFGGPYQYSIDNGDSYQVNNPNFTNLPAGVYNITVADAENCVESGGTVTITQPAEIVITAIDSTDVLCNGETTGEINVTASGGTGSLFYSTDNGTSYPYAVGSPVSVAAGAYDLSVKDANNCVIDGPAITIEEPAPLTIQTVDLTHVLCFGDNTGDLTIRARGGAKPYQFSIDGTTFQADSVFSNLPAGTYPIHVLDANSCELIGSDAVITEPTELTILTVDQAEILCFGDNSGELTIRARGGAKPYQFSIDGTTFQSDSVFSNLAPGTYPIHVQDANSCAVTGTDVVITEPAELTILTVDQTDVLCNGNNNGTLTIRARGGTIPYQFSIDGTTFQPDSIFSSLAPGTYPIHVQDANGCAVTGTDVVITEPTALTILTIDQTDNLCFGESNGDITIRARGGVKPYQFSIDGATFQSDSLFSNLAAGTYPITVQDANNCELIGGDVVITEPAELTIPTVDQSDLLCFGDNSGTLTIHARGGTKPYQFSIDGATFQPDSIFNSLAAGTYSIDVVDANNCALTGADVVITEPAELTILTVDQTDVQCFGENNGGLTIRARGGVKPYQFSIDGATFQSDSVFSTLAPGTYSIDVLDANNCALTGVDVVITEPADLTILTVDQTDVVCFGDNTGDLTIRARGGVKPYQFSIDGTSFQADSVFSGLTAGTYSIDVVDANNCTVTGTDITITEPAELTIGIVSVSHIFSTADGVITVEAAGGTTPYSFTLQPTGTVQESGTFTFTVAASAGDYTIEVVDQENCGPVSTETITMVDSTFVNAGSLQLLEANIYPNPTTGMVTIEFSTDKKEMELKVFSIEGRMVVNTRIFSKGGWVSEKIDLSGYEKGVYMIRVDSQTLTNGVVLK